MKQTKRNNKHNHYSEHGYCPGCFKHRTKEKRMEDIKKWDRMWNKITKKGSHWMKQRRINKQNTCIHEQKKPEKRTKQGRKLHGKQIENCWCQTSRFLHSLKANAWKTIRHDRFTAHPSQFLIIKLTRCTNFLKFILEWNCTRFRQFLCTSSGVFHCTHSNGICYRVLLTVCEQDEDGPGSSVLILFACCQQTCMTYTITVCTVKNSWWCTEELSETADFHSKNKFEKLVHLVGFIIRIYDDVRSHERQIPSWFIFHNIIL